MQIIFEVISWYFILSKIPRNHPSYDSDRKSKISKNIGIRPMMVEPMIVKRDEY